MKAENLKLAKALLPQAEEILYEFVRENLDPNLDDMDDMVEQQEDILIYVKENLYDWI